MDVPQGASWGMKTFLPWFPTVRVAFTVSLLALAAAATPARAAAGVPQPKQYAALLAKARAGTLEVIHGEPATTPKLFALKARAKGPSTSENFSGSFRATAKTSFVSGQVETFGTLDPLF